MNRVLLLPFLLFCLACGDDERAPPSAPPTDGGTAGTAGRGGSGGGTAGSDVGGTSGDGSTDPPGAPLVEITAPLGVEDPADGGVLLLPSVPVVCEVEPSDSSQRIDGSSVAIRAVSASGVELASAMASTGDEPGQYTATLQLPEEAHGRVSFECSVLDTSTPPLEGTDRVETFYDAGPEILVGEPAIGSFERAGEIPFSFTVAPRPLVADDDGAAVSDVQLVVAGVEIENLEEVSPGTYSAAVDLTDATLFESPPRDTVAVGIVARNSREPEPREARVPYNFQIDARGPDIDITTHEPSMLVGGQEDLTFLVSDQSSVDEDTIRVRINNVEFSYADADQAAIWSKQGSNYTVRFDTTDPRFGSLFQLTVSVFAADDAGNLGSAHVTLMLDNEPPFVHLDPAPVREFSEATGDCSLPFDPLGPFAASDEDRVLRVSRFRALVWDGANSAPGQREFHFGKALQESVVLYLRRTPGDPIVLDTNDDGICDDIIEDEDVRQAQLFPIRAEGTAERGPTATGPACEYDAPNNQNGLLATLCERRSDLFRVIDHSMPGLESVVYGMGNIDGETCTGGDWEIGVLIRGEGWVCLAAEAEDIPGNHAISPPLAVCYDNGVAPAPDCSPAAKPNCALDCTPTTERAPETLSSDGTWPVRLEQ